MNGSEGVGLEEDGCRGRSTGEGASLEEPEGLFHVWLVVGVVSVHNLSKGGAGSAVSWGRGAEERDIARGGGGA